jgi:predicted O-linked N-acetylglucosamine transferase (SPINDLY family)
MNDDLRKRLTLAVERHRRGELHAARSMYGKILVDHPRSFDALHLLGVLCADSGAYDEGIDLIRRALAVEGANPAAHYSLASALARKGDTRSALAHLERALALEPDHADAWQLRGNLLQGCGALPDAVKCYREAIRVNPSLPAAFNNLAAAQRGLRLLAEALASAERALQLKPAYPQALNNRGLILLDMKRGSAAVEDFRRALESNCGFPEALHNLGTALMQLRRFAEARDAFARLMEIAPKFPHAEGSRLYAQLSCCDWTDFEPRVATLTRAVERGEHAVVPMTLLCIAGSAALQRRCAEIYTQGYYPPRAMPLHKPVPRGRDRIRVAYLSGDLGEHAVSYLLAGVFERHDAQRFETIALSWDRRGEGSLRRRVEAAFSSFIDIGSRSDAEVANLMRDLDVNIAVDLTGHTLGQRTDILARRAAPLQVNYLGLPATLGAPYIDYLIADRFLIPEPQLSQYSERIVWLPECYQPNDDRRPIVPELRPRSAFGLPDEGFVFCSFNRTPKLNPWCFDVWMRLLQSVPGSVFWLLAASETTAENLRREARARGVESGRLLFAGEVPYLEYLGRHRHADLIMDTLPFNGGTTVSDALTMGVPVVTCAGESFAGRMAGSLLRNLGLDELVASSLAQYEATALRLARNPGELQAIRDRLDPRRRDHAFFDTDRYRRHLEAAYQIMWERHAAGLPPATIEVPPMPSEEAPAEDQPRDSESRRSGPMNGA